MCLNLWHNRILICCTVGVGGVGGNKIKRGRRGRAGAVPNASLDVVSTDDTWPPTLFPIRVLINGFARRKVFRNGKQHLANQSIIFNFGVWT